LQQDANYCLTWNSGLARRENAFHDGVVKAMVQRCLRIFLCLAICAGNPLTGNAFASSIGAAKSVRVYLNPHTGRFWTMDTYAGNNQDPLSLHKYLYCHDNPVNGIDPSGQDLISLSISMSIGTSLDSMYNGGVTVAGTAMQSTMMGIQQGKNSQQIMTGYLIDTAIGVGVGIAIAKVAGLLSESIYGAEMEVSESISQASREAVREAEVAVAEATAIQQGSKWYGYIDQFFPGSLREGAVIYSTTHPSKISGGLWATDARSLVRAGGSASTYGAGSQSRAAKTVYVYRIKGKTPAAFGGTEANHQYGDGGYSQYYIPKQGVGNVEYSGVTFDLL
jgi:RHS repeat-associated protein